MGAPGAACPTETTGGAATASQDSRGGSSTILADAKWRRETGQAEGEGQQLAEEKGITKRKRSKLAFDEPTQDWRRRHGYGKANGVNDLAIAEAKRGG